MRWPEIECLLMQANLTGHLILYTNTGRQILIQHDLKRGMAREIDILNVLAMQLWNLQFNWAKKFIQLDILVPSNILYCTFITNSFIPGSCGQCHDADHPHITRLVCAMQLSKTVLYVCVSWSKLRNVSHPLDQWIAYSWTAMGMWSHSLLLRWAKRQEDQIEPSAIFDNCCFPIILQGYKVETVETMWGSLLIEAYKLSAAKHLTVVPGNFL